MATRTTEIPAIYSTEAEALFDKLGVGDAYRAGELRCAACDAPLNEHGIGVVMLRDGTVHATCARRACVDEVDA
jgi:hypothetical protein